MSLKISAGTGIYKTCCKRLEIELPKLKNTITEIKNSVNILINRLYTAEERTEQWI